VRDVRIFAIGSSWFLRALFLTLLAALGLVPLSLLSLLFFATLFEGSSRLHGCCPGEASVSEAERRIVGRRVESMGMLQKARAADSLESLRRGSAPSDGNFEPTCEPAFPIGCQEE